MYEIRDSAFNIIDTAREFLDGPEVPEHRREDVFTRGRRAGITCIAVDVTTGVVVAGFGKRSGLLAHRWRTGDMPGLVRGAA